MYYDVCRALKIKEEDGGALIGRHARAELWTRFVNGAVKPMDAEIICNLTRGVRQQERVEEIQGKCCVLLDTGKSWEYIGGMVQLMANKQQVAMSQGLLDFGADFQADLERAAEWVARSIRAIDETIRVLKDGLKQSGRKRDVAQRIGVNTEVEVDAAETLRDLQVLRKQYEMIGNYPELVQKAEYWDGESEVDPVGDYLEHARRERLEAEAEGEMSADEYLEAQARREAQEAVPGLFGDGMSMEMRAVESPEKLGEAQVYKARTGSEKFAPDAKGKEPLLPVNLYTVLADGSEGGRNDLIADESGSVFWGRLPKLEALKDKGYDALNIIMRIGGKSDGFSHIVKKHGQWIMDATGIDDPVRACKAFISDVLGEVRKIQYQKNKGKDALLLKQGEEQRYFIVVVGKDRVEPKFAAIRTAFVADRAGRFDSEISVYEGEEALELRIPMSSFGENQRLRGASERQDRSSEYPDTAASSPSKDIMPEVGSIVKHEELISYKNKQSGNTFSASMETAREMGLLSDGHLVADNAVVVEPGVSFSIEALHASPHKFREFSTDKMGTGEGHQAFGWGLYFSGGRESNEHYYRQFASYRMRYGVDGAVEENESAGYAAVYKVIGDVMLKHGGDEMYLRETNRITAMLHDGWRIEDLQKKDAKWWMEKQPGAYKAAYKAALKELAERGVMVERVDKPSINYRVDLNVDESELLDWDGAVSDELYAEAERVSPDSFVTVPRKNVKGRTVYEALQYELGTAKAASEWLAARGYKGIKYLDGGSRDAGVGTHNYVIFSGRDVKITGINASGDYGAAWEEMEPVESPVTFSMRTKAEPKVKGIGYKVFYRGKDGKLYPPMVANPGGADTPVGVWLDADEGVRAGVSKTGRQQVKAGGKGTQGGSGTLAYRPGWHLGKIPYAIQFNRKNPVTGERDLFPADFVWAEVEYAADVDYQEEAMGYGVNKNGKFQHALAGLPRVPEDGYYEYRTNPNPKTEPWIITGAMKVVRVLTREQVDEMVRAAGREPQMVEGDEPGAPVTFSMETVREMAEIKAEAEKAGTFMKAPNGKRSQLTEMQWLQVRTGAFKRWFGDWENDAENASKVVDENGEPLVVYRGARVDEGNILGVSTPREKFIDDINGNLYPGAVWLSDNAYTAQTYMEPWVLDDRPEAKGTRVDKAYENGTKLYTEENSEFLFSGTYVTRKGVPMYKAKSVVTSRLAKDLFAPGSQIAGSLFIREKGVENPEERQWVTHNSRYPYPTSHKEAVSKANEERLPVDTIEVASNSRLYACFVNARNPKYVDFKGDLFRSMGRKLGKAANEGHDALIALNVKDPGSYNGRNRVKASTTIAVFESNQIKSATDNRGTFDGGNADITFSVIGEKAKTWGKYKDRAFEGRDDGKMRAEIDASKARVKAGIFGVDKAEEYRQLIAQRGEQRYNLGDVLDYEELYEAYPELRVRDVTFRKLEDGVRGRVEGWGGIALAPELRFHEEELRSVLLHEVQHAVQRIEGFARGGNTEGVYDRVQAEIGDMNWELRLLEREMRFFEAPGQGRDYLRAALGFLRTPKRAVKRSGLAMALRRPGESVEETAERCVAELRRVYDELVEKDTEWLGLYVREQDEWRYAMPRDVDFGDEGAVARALRKVEGLPGRRSVARGVAPVKAREMKALVAKKWRFERLARDYRYEPFELYRRLAGEIEARGVQARLGMTAAERAKRPFNETLEFPGEALVTFSVIGERAETWEKYKDRAFRGRDDGMLRAELDASGARVRMDVLPGGELRAYRKLVNARVRVAEDEVLDAEGREVLEEFVRVRNEMDGVGERLNEAREEAFMEVYEEALAVRKRLDAAREEVKAVLGGWFERCGVTHGVSALTQKLLDDVAVSVVMYREDERVMRALEELPSRVFMPLEEVLDFGELYEAYPELRGVDVYVMDLGLRARGCLSVYGQDGRPSSITLNKLLLYRGEEAVRSTLLHEVQHWVQWREGFARGGNTEGVGAVVAVQLAQVRDEIAQVRNEKYWLNAPVFALDVLKRLRRVQERPRAVLKMGERFGVHEVENVEVMAAEAVELLWLEYADMAQEDALGTRAYAPGAEYALPVAEGAEVTAEKVEGLMAAIKALPKRKRRGQEARLDERLEVLYGQLQKLGKLEVLDAGEQYKRLAGEIEARGVQARLNMTVEERADNPFNEALEYPGEALVTFSMAPMVKRDIRLAAYNKLDKKTHIPLCSMPTILRMLGEPEAEVYTLPGTISKLVYTHNLAHVEVYRAIEELEDPLLVYKDSANSYLFVLDMMATNNKGDKGNVVVAIQMQRSDSGHYMLSAYPLDSYDKIEAQNEQGHLVYIREVPENKQASPPTDGAPNLFQSDLVRSAVKGGLNGIVKTYDDIVKWKESNNTNFSASMERASLNALEVLRTRADEREGERLVKDWQKQCELLGMMHDDKEEMYGDVENQGKHELKRDELLKLPAALAYPICITESKRRGCIEVITEIIENGTNALVAVQIGRKIPGRGEGRVNRIASIYGKEDLEGYVTHKLLYADKERTRNWMVNRGLQLSTVDQFLAGSDTIVQTPADLVKYKEEKNLSL
ncbi:MAG: hypothetical protein Q4A24_09290 [Akkermansia sp.]|nr:hypothetical protein [Akkermansia sp.]